MALRRTLLLRVRVVVVGVEHLKAQHRGFSWHTHMPHFYGPSKCISGAPCQKVICAQSKKSFLVLWLCRFDLVFQICLFKETLLLG